MKNSTGKHKRRISVVYSTPDDSDSRNIHCDTDTVLAAEMVGSALEHAGYDIQMVPVGVGSLERIPQIRAECIFNLVDWTGKLAPFAVKAVTLIDRTGIPYTGAPLDAYRSTADKIGLKKIFTDNRISTPPWHIYDTTDNPHPDGLRLPVILKPAKEHCSVGITPESVVSDNKIYTKRVITMLRIYDQPILAEEFIDGAEYHVTMLEKNGIPEMLPPVEISYNCTGIEALLSYKGRWDVDSPEFARSRVKPADNKSMIDLIRDACMHVYHASGVRDYARVDLRVRDGKVYILEINANPGLDDDDDYELTLAFKLAGMTFAGFLQAIIRNCFYRFSQIPLPVLR